MLLRIVVTCAALAACEPRLQQTSLPELVRPQPLSAIHVPMLMFVPGESMAWNVHAKGFTIGRVELSVDEHEVHSRFETGKLVSAFGHVRHELTTVLGQNAPHAATEVLEMDGETTRIAAQFNGPRFVMGDHVGAVPGGNSGHTLHSALGVIRAWAQPAARSGFLYVVHAGVVYRIDVARPLVEDLRGVHTLRIEMRIQVPAGDAIAVTMWLRDSDRIPLRFELSSGDVHVTAELLGTEA